MTIKNSLKKILSLILIFSIIFFNISIGKVIAIENDDNKSYIITENIEYDIKKYAESIFQKHLIALIDAQEIKGNVSDYILGTPFKIYNVIKNTNSTCFPIIRNSKIVLILEVYGDKFNYLSSLSKSFSENLEILLKNMQLKSKEFILLTDGINLKAYDGENNIKLYEIYENEHNEKFLSKNDSVDLKNKNKLSLTDLTKKMNTHNVGINNISMFNYNPRDISLFSSISPYEGKTLNVKGVDQGNHPWCWAATTAAMINYYKNYSLTAKRIAEYVFPNNPEQGGNWANMKKAYNHWGLYPTHKGVIGFNTVAWNIDRNKPMHIRLKGHSVGLIGYQRWIPNYGGDRVLILLEPNGGVKKSVTLKNNNFYYSLGGGSNAWVYTIEF
ncbi:papain-like cysteine protease family protein [Helcococcus ovis]|uniref:papain-like cysteine protease family protein n=3 Tax=Helcococcus ovis TaxID=72026 RepID=UPI0014308EAB|nr:papain-like cysteine protease family protein [Helcococcus ovis]WNZ01858.1 papain-like cysteine protease family protein [Helcococcus ovis]